MNNSVKIFLGDMKRLLKSPFALIIAIGLCFLPALYAWFNIYSNWNPYANTSNIKIAAASLDKGYAMEDGTIKNMGIDVLEELKTNESINWVVLESSEDAIEGVNSGEYYAAVVISEDFSESMYSLLGDNFKRPVVNYYENEKKNAVATKITDTAVSTLTQNINKKFIETVASMVFTKSNEVADNIEEGSYVTSIEEDLKELSTNLKEYRKTIDEFVGGNKNLKTEIKKANKELKEISEGLGNSTDKFVELKGSLDGTINQVDIFSEKIDNTLYTIEMSIKTISAEIDDADIPGHTENTMKSIKQLAEDIETLSSQFEEIATAIKANLTGNNGTNSKVNSALESIKMIQTTINQMTGMLKVYLQANLNGSAIVEMENKTIKNTKDMLNTLSTQIEDVRNAYKESIAPSILEMLYCLDDTLIDVQNIIASLDKTLDNTSVVLGNVDGAVTSADASLKQINGTIDSLSESIDKIIDWFNGLSDSDEVVLITQFLGADSRSYGEFFSSPVSVNTQAVFEVDTYGSAMTPFYTALALWFGGTVLVSLIKVKADAKDIKNVKAYQLFFGRYILFFMLGQLQALIIVIGNIYLIGSQMVHPFMYWFAASVASFAFTLFIYTMALSFGDFGKAFAVIIMVLQIAGSSGTFPIELLPDIYKNIYIFFPFPYAIDAMREAVAGMYEATYLENLFYLLIFAVTALVIGLFIRLPFIKINHFVEERMEDTDMM